MDETEYWLELVEVVLLVLGVAGLFSVIGMLTMKWPTRTLVILIASLSVFAIVASLMGIR